VASVRGSFRACGPPNDVVAPIAASGKGGVMSRFWTNPVGVVAAMLAALASQAFSHNRTGAAAKTQTGETHTTAETIVGTTSAAPKPASEATKRAHAEQLRRAPFANTKDFANAKR